MLSQWSWMISLLGSVCVIAEEDPGSHQYVWAQILRASSLQRDGDLLVATITDVFVKNRWWPCPEQTLTIPFHNIACWEVHRGQA